MQEDHTFAIYNADIWCRLFHLYYLLQAQVNSQCNLPIKNLLLLGIWWSTTPCVWPGHSKTPVTIFTHIKVTHLHIPRYQPLSSQVSAALLRTPPHWTMPTGGHLPFRKASTTSHSIQMQALSIISHPTSFQANQMVCLHTELRAWQGKCQLYNKKAETCSQLMPGSQEFVVWACLPLPCSVMPQRCQEYSGTEKPNSPLTFMNDCTTSGLRYTLRMNAAISTF